MTIIKVKGLESNYTIVPNDMINDSLSWEARGLLLYLGSKPEGWEVCITDLVNQTKEAKKKSGRDSVRRIINELIDAGYMKKTQARIKGKFERNDYIVSLSTMTEKPSTVNPTQERKELIKERKNNIDKNTGIFGAELFHIDELDSKEFRQCHIAMEIIKDYKSSGTKVYDGPMSCDDWALCEEIISNEMIEDFNIGDYLELMMSEGRFDACRKESGFSLKDIIFGEYKYDDEYLRSKIMQ